MVSMRTPLIIVLLVVLVAINVSEARRFGRGGRQRVQRKPVVLRRPWFPRRRCPPRKPEPPTCAEICSRYSRPNSKCIRCAFSLPDNAFCDVPALTSCQDYPVIADIAAGLPGDDFDVDECIERIPSFNRLISRRFPTYEYQCGDFTTPAGFTGRVKSLKCLEKYHNSRNLRVMICNAWEFVRNCR